MVSLASIIAMFITLVICMFVPIIALIVYAVKNKGKGVWIAWLLGAAGFFVMQIIIRMTILSILQMQPGFVAWASGHYAVYTLSLAFTAGLFEVVARYVVAKLLKKKQCYEVAVGAGLGHGGIESIVLIGMTYINNILYSFMINSGYFREVTYQMENTGLDLTSLLSVEYQLINTPPVTFLLAGYERILTIILHVAMTVIVFYFVYKGKDFVGIILCLLIHTLIDLVPGISTSTVDYLIQKGISLPDATIYIVIYALLTIMAIAGIIITASIRKKWKANK